MACGYAKRSCEGGAWEDKVGEKAMRILKQILQDVSTQDPVQGKWLVSDSGQCTVWTYATSFATGVMVCHDNCVIEDGGW